MRLHIGEIERLCSESQIKSYRRRKLKLTNKADAFGEIVIRTVPRACDVCGETCLVTIGYKSAKLPEPIKVEDTILSSWRAWIGLDCGDYGKLHRQVAHILDRIKARANNP